MLKIRSYVKKFTPQKEKVSKRLDTFHASYRSAAVSSGVADDLSAEEKEDESSLPYFLAATYRITPIKIASRCATVVIGGAVIA